jgi:hypothetical protein
LLTFGGRKALYSVHHQKTGWNALLAFKPALENYRSVGDRWVANVFVEKAAERSQALESYLKADISNRQSA